MRSPVAWWSASATAARRAEPGSAAERVGYEPEAVLSKVFKRQFEMPPGPDRRQARFTVFFNREPGASEESGVRNGAPRH
jgi:AraC-like DNA-binding protein